MTLVIILTVLALFFALVLGVKLADNNKPSLSLSTLIIFLTIICAALSHSSLIRITKGKLATPNFLNEKIIYKIVGRINAEDRGYEVFVLENGKGDIWCVTSKPLPVNVVFVKVAGGKLVPADQFDSVPPDAAALNSSSEPVSP